MKRLALALCVVALAAACKRAEDTNTPAADTATVPAAPVDSMKADSMKAASDTTKPN